MIIHKVVEESEHVRGPFTGMLGGGSSHKDERSLRKEMKALEIEEKALKLEKQRDREIRRAERIREGRRSRSADRVSVGGGVRVERNKKGKMSLVV